MFWMDIRCTTIFVLLTEKLIHVGKEPEGLGFIMGRLTIFLLLASCIVIALVQGGKKDKDKDKDKDKGGCKKKDEKNIDKLCLQKGENMIHENLFMTLNMLIMRNITNRDIRVLHRV